MVRPLRIRIHQRQIDETLNVKVSEQQDRQQEGFVRRFEVRESRNDEGRSDSQRRVGCGGSEQVGRLEFCPTQVRCRRSIDHQQESRYP